MSPAGWSLGDGTACELVSLSSYAAGFLLRSARSVLGPLWVPSSHPAAPTPPVAAHLTATGTRVPRPAVCSPTDSSPGSLFLATPKSQARFCLRDLLLPLPGAPFPPGSCTGRSGPHADSTCPSAGLLPPCLNWKRFHSTRLCSAVLAGPQRPMEQRVCVPCVACCLPPWAALRPRGAAVCFRSSPPASSAPETAPGLSGARSIATSDSIWGSPGQHTH